MGKKSKDPAFLFYPSDFILGTYTMSDEQVGKYIRLLCLQFSNGGRLTYDDVLTVLNKDEDELDRKDKEILKKFQIDDDGYYYNGRLLQEITIRQERAVVNKENGRKGGNPNFTKGNGNPYYQKDNQTDIPKDNQTVMSTVMYKDNRKINIALENENKDIIKDFDLKEETSINKPKPKKKDIDIYFEDSNLNSMFIDFMKMRKSLKNGAMTDRAITMMINKLNKYDVDVAIKMLEQSIVNNWKDVYEIKGNFNSQKQEKEEYHVKTTRI